MKRENTRSSRRCVTVAMTVIGTGIGLDLGSRASECPPMDASLTDYSEQFAPYHTCTVTELWSAPVDVDGDGLVDFRHRRLDAEQRGAYSAQDWGLQRDQIEAFYPEAHVDIWVEYYATFSVAPGALIGDPVLLECAPPLRTCRAWSSEYPPAQPYLQAEGLGIIARFSDRGPCELGCISRTIHGVLRPDDPTDWSPWRVLVGFRIEQSGEWHLGWMRLEFRQPWPELRPPYPEIGGVFLLDQAIHPEPETPIAAGEPPRPTLHASVEGDEIVLSWHVTWTDYVLERSASVTGAVWEDVPGVENNTVRLSKAGPAAFFRLEQHPNP